MVVIDDGNDDSENNDDAVVDVSRGELLLSDGCDG